MWSSQCDERSHKTWVLNDTNNHIIWAFLIYLKNFQLFIILICNHEIMICIICFAVRVWIEKRPFHSQEYEGSCVKILFLSSDFTLKKTKGYMYILICGPRMCMCVLYHHTAQCTNQDKLRRIFPHFQN